MAPAQAVFFGRNEFVRGGQLWGSSRRHGRPLDAMPTGLLVSGKRAAAVANKPIVDALLQVLALAGWRMRRWLTLRTCCCAARDALPAFFTDDMLSNFRDSRPPPFKAGLSSDRSALRAIEALYEDEESLWGYFVAGAPVLLTDNIRSCAKAAVDLG